MHIRTGETLHVNKTSLEVYSILGLSFGGEVSSEDEPCYTVDVDCLDTTIVIYIRCVRDFIRKLNEAGVEVGYYTLGDIYQLIV